MGTVITHGRRVAMLAALALALGSLGACSQAAEEVAEQAIEGALSSAGAQVDLEDGSVTIEDEAGNEMAVGEGVELPSTWPAEVPIYEGGTLTMAMVSPAEGTANAMWTLDEAPETAVASMRAALEAAGYMLESETTAAGLTMLGFVGDGHRIAITAGTVDGTASLTLTVTSGT